MAKKPDITDPTLARSGDFNRQLFETLPMGLAVCDMEGKLTYVNQAYASIIGRTIEETLDLTYWEITPRDYEAQEGEQLEKLAKTKQYGPYVKEYLHKDGRRIPVRLSGVIINENGEDFIWSSVENISDIVETQEALSRSEEQFRLVTDSIPALILYIDKEYKYQFSNRVAEDLYGLQIKKMMGNRVEDVLGKKEFLKLKDKLDTALAGEPVDYDTVSDLPDGSTRHLRRIYTPDVGDNGEVEGIFVLIQDVTERKRAQKLLAEQTSELNFQKFALDQHAIVSIANTKGKITYANDLFCQSSGYTLEELIGQDHRILNSGFHPPEFFADLWKTIASGKVWHGIIRNKGKDGGYYWVDATIVPFLNEKGKPFQYIAIRTEITERIAAKEEAERANQAKSDFLSAMSHELRTPLNAILGFGQLLESNQKNPLTDRQKDQVRHIMKGGEHLLELINEVLDLARIEAGKLNLSIDVVNTQALLQDCLVFAESLASRRNITIENRVVGPMPPILGDHLRSKQVLLNLFSNAVKYNNDGGKIWLDAEVIHSSHLKISVTDNGPGIPKKKQSGLFQAFNRLGAETTEVEGTGIGLVLTKKLIEEMGGDVGFESSPGKGSSFWIEVPIFSDSQGEATSEQSAGDSTVTDLSISEASRVLLYVEDNPANLALMEDIVEDIPNLTMISTHTAELGLAVAEAQTPDIIVLDINLPGMDGFEAVRKLKRREATKDIPVLALSANAMPNAIERGKKAGFNNYLTKPVDVAQLLASLREALDE